MTIGAGIQTVASPVTTLSLPSGATYVIPSGQYLVTPGKYSFLQNWDPSTCTYRTLGTPTQSDPSLVSSDGFNKRVINLTGTVVGAVITNGGTGYTNGIYFPAGLTGGPNGAVGIPGNPNAVVQAGTAAAPSITVAAGGGTNLAQGVLIVGGAINSTITITTAGTLYTYPPTLILSNPPPGGWPATATCTISAGAINAVTVTNQGAGYSVAPTVTIVRHPLDNTGSGGVLTVNATLTGSGAVTGISFPINGAGHTSVPAITFSPASTTAATAIMCFTITAGVAQTSASNMGTGNIGFALGALTSGSATLTNPDYSTNLFTPRMAQTGFNTTAGGGTTFTDGGLHQIIPTGIAYAVLSNGTISAAATAVAQTVGGTTDTTVMVSTDI